MKGKLDVKDIIEWAKRKEEKKPSDKISIRHLNTKNRAATRFEASTNFQIEADINSFKQELKREKKLIYLCEQGKKILQTTGLTGKATADTELTYHPYS